MHVGDRRLQMHMLHWKRNSLRALWMGQKLERASLFCRRFCPAWLESEEVHPGERESYSAFPLLWQHTTRAWLRGWTHSPVIYMSLCIIGWSLIDYGGQHVILPNYLYFILMICQPECWEFWGIWSRSFLRCCAFNFSGGSKTFVSSICCNTR